MAKRFAIDSLRVIKFSYPCSQPQSGIPGAGRMCVNQTNNCCAHDEEHCLGLLCNMSVAHRHEAPGKTSKPALSSSPPQSKSCRQASADGGYGEFALDGDGFHGVGIEVGAVPIRGLD
jgi:hypothetical protein